MKLSKVKRKLIIYPHHNNKISVIVCSKQAPEWDLHKRNIDKTVEYDYEYIRIDNRSNNFGLCGAYNHGVAKSQGDILVFVHEDVYFMETGWGRVLADKFGNDATIGLIGVAGTQYLVADHPAWLAAGRPFLRGRVIHELNAEEQYYLSVFSWDKADTEVVAVDGLFFAIRTGLFNRIRFDEATFNHFHFYDLDICMQVRKTHRLIVTWDILVKHQSAGNCNSEWMEAGRRFLSKYKHDLPASCSPHHPQHGKKSFGENYNLKGIAPQATII